MARQCTLKESFSLSGKGLHTGLDIQIRFNPAPEGHGIKIQRIDLPEQPIVDALAENVSATQRGTVLKKGEVQVSTIEHALAALYAMGVDNCLIEVNAPEFPILDGSAIAYYEAIKKVGFEEQALEKDYYIIKQKIEYKDEESGSSLIILPDDEFSVQAMVAYPSKVLSNQYASLENMEDFGKEIAAARTFVFVREIELLMKSGLIKGGDLDNAIVIYDEIMSQSQLDAIAEMMSASKQDASHLGYLNNKPLVFDNEPARHKLLDVLGDISLIGKPIKGRVIATRPGHGINTSFAKMIRKEIKRLEVQAPVYNPEAKPVMDINQIRTLLPHRWPFLMVDKVIERGERHIVGLKNVTVNETMFMGHFPDEPVMPGVLLVEAMAQCGGLLVLGTVDEPKRYSTYFMKIDNVKFRQKVVPGDTVIFRVEFITEIRRGCAYMKGYAFVGEKIATECEFMAQVIKNK